MDLLHRAELLVAMVTLTALSRRLLVPYPIVLVLCGLVLGLLPVSPASSWTRASSSCYSSADPLVRRLRCLAVGIQGAPPPDPPARLRPGDRNDPRPGRPL